MGSAATAAPATVERRARRISAIGARRARRVAGVWSMQPRVGSAQRQPEDRDRGWARWNYKGYEKKPAWPEYRGHHQDDGQAAARAARCGSRRRASPTDQQYGTTLALELLPYFTHGRIGSMEGLYFESSATTSFHFLTVSELARHPSNPVRGLVYGTIDDFDVGVKHLQMLGVRYFMAWTPEAKAQGRRERRPAARRDGPRPRRRSDPKGWKIYEVARLRPRRRACSTSRSSRKSHAGTTSSCFGSRRRAAERARSRARARGSARPRRGA